MDFSILLNMSLSSYEQQAVMWQEKSNVIRDLLKSLGFEIKEYLTNSGRGTIGWGRWYCYLSNYPKRFAEYSGGQSWERDKITFYHYYGKPSSKKTFYIEELEPEMIKQWASDFVKSCKEKQSQIRTWKMQADFCSKEDSNDEG